ncbi:hypothetical protein [Legionella israelensis]|uniref:hypothetical protein n=1 Tax=Legionella israelensis TaxID=454 RepID=UPI001ADD040E|nr:hypothetical protein [Legionella israelensis]
MTGFFETISKHLSIRAFSSSSPHRNAERACGATQVIASSVQSLSPATLVPAKFAQSLISFYTIFRNDTHASEKTLHVLQGLIALTQLGLVVTLLFQDLDCNEEEGFICTAAFLMDLLYAGTLATGWVPSEFSKDPYLTPEAKHRGEMAEKSQDEDEDETEEEDNSLRV